MLVDRIATLAWRLRRVGQIEAGIGALGTGNRGHGTVIGCQL